MELHPSSQRTSAPPTRRAVLVVEDEPIVAMDLQQTLNELGYDAFAIAESADEALETIRKRRPDLVLMDIRIRGNRDGVATAEAILREVDLPIVFLTAHADDATVERVTRTAPYGYLLKPARGPDLRRALDLAFARHDMERHVRHREHWFSTTLSCIADGVVTVDPAGKVTFMNAAAEAMTGLQASAALGLESEQVLKLTGPEGFIEPPLRIALRERRPVKLPEASLENAANGTRRLISDSAAPVSDQQETLGAVMIFHDVTEQRALEQKLEQTARLASLGTLAAGVAHEVNNPLTVIVTNGEYLAQELARHAAVLGPDLEEIQLSLSDLTSAASRIRTIVSDLRSFSRPPDPNAGSDLQRVVDWTVRSTAVHTRTRAQIVSTIPPSLPHVQGDETRLGQVMVNLVLNAAHAIPDGQPERHRIEIAAALDGARVIVTVTDTGAGISEANLKRVLDPFFTTKPVGVGTGLGLSISHGIVRSFGGELTVSSELGRGTVVRVPLPIAAS